MLGKKSWNVYNKDNIEKVRRDEEKAELQKEEEERRMQEVDAERRLQILRGETLEPILASVAEESTAQQSKGGRDRKRRKLEGEDDTDRDIRLAKAQATSENLPLTTVVKSSISSSISSAPLTDRKGNINLFPEERSRKGGQKNAEAQAEEAKKKKEYEDQFTMRFSNAAGFKQGLETPWYSANNAAENDLEVIPKDAWGNEDPRRKERDTMRLNSSDPLAFMKKGVKQLKQAERDRAQWLRDREREFSNPIGAAKSHRKRHRSPEIIEELSLDISSISSRRSRKHSEREHRHHTRRPKSHSRSREHHRHRSERADRDKAVLSNR